MPRSKEDDAARKREGRSARSAARQHRLQHRLALEAATLGAAMTVAAAVDDPVAVEAATLGAAMTVAAAVDDPVAFQKGPPHFILTLTPSESSNGMVTAISSGND